MNGYDTIHILQAHKSRQFKTSGCGYFATMLLEVWPGQSKNCPISIINERLDNLS